MKYYTKEWFELMQCPGNPFRKIPDAAYSDADIKKLYEKKMKREIASERKDYNLEPFFLPIEVSDETFDPEDWLYVDEETGQFQRPSSAQEVRDRLAEEQQEAMEEFQNRPPFDPTEIIADFEQGYRMELETCRNHYPAWMIESVDHRLIALGYLPETAYERYKKEMKEREKRWKAMNRSAQKALRREKIPDQINEALCLHDASLLSLQKQGTKLVMIVKKDGDWFEEDGETPYRRVVFENAEILEREKGLRTRKYMENGIYVSNVSFLCHELYEKDGIYEVHMMFWTFSGLPYLTVRCGNITYMDMPYIRR